MIKLITIFEDPPRLKRAGIRIQTRNTVLLYMKLKLNITDFSSNFNLGYIWIPDPVIMGVECMCHKPDLAPSNFLLFIYMKYWLWSQLFNNNQEFMEGVKM